MGKIDKILEEQNRPARTDKMWVLLGVDLLCISAAVFLAYLLRFDFSFAEKDKMYLAQSYHYLPFVLLVRFSCFGLLGHYRSVSIYSSIQEILGMAYAILIGSAIFAVTNQLIQNVPGIASFPTNTEGYLLRAPWGVVWVEGLLSFLIVGFARIWPRVYLIYFSSKKAGEKRLVVIGANKDGVAAARSLGEDPYSGYRPVAFIDNDPGLHGKVISGIRVEGAIEKLHEVLEQVNAEEILIAQPDVSPKELRDIILECEKARLKFRRIPSVNELMSGRVSVDEIRPVEIEDLLGRPQVELMLEETSNYLRGETVLITGAGGSIGSELCRQILRYDPEQLVLVGRGENSIYEIATELDYDYKTDQFKLIIGDVRDQSKMESVFEKYKPAIVFHAAAHKHVPLMELHPDEAIQNNVLATRSLAELSIKSGVKKFISISTDKAVRPTNVMGASKRLAEMVLLDLADRSDTIFHVVRFGNVLGSRGSVIPLIRRQIRKGGPVTVTHPEVTRFFMTIPEAVSLVLQAGSFQEKKQLFLLDMGQPVKILDLVRNIITLSGYEPDIDIEIKITGLRPGEKLFEELLTEGEGVKKTDKGKLFVAQLEAIDHELLQTQLSQLKAVVDQKDNDAIRKILRETVPEYHPAV